MKKDRFKVSIYQNDEVIFHNPSPERITHLMDKIIHFDKLLENVDCKEV